MEKARIVHGAAACGTRGLVFAPPKAILRLDMQRNTSSRSRRVLHASRYVHCLTFPLTLGILVALTMGCGRSDPTDGHGNTEAGSFSYVSSGRWESGSQASRAFERGDEELRAIESLGFVVGPTIESQNTTSRDGSPMEVTLRTRHIEFSGRRGELGPLEGTWWISDRPTDSLDWRLTVHFPSAQRDSRSSRPDASIARENADSAFGDSIRAAIFPEELTRVLRLRESPGS